MGGAPVLAVMVGTRDARQLLSSRGAWVHFAARPSAENALQPRGASRRGLPRVKP